MSANYLIELYDYNNTTPIKKTATPSCLIYQTFNSVMRRPKAKRTAVKDTSLSDSNKAFSSQ